MDYRKFHRFLLSLAIIIAVLTIIGTAYLCGVAIEAGFTLVTLLLIWIGWEIHRVADLAGGLMEGFVEGFAEAITERKLDAILKKSSER